MFPQLRVGSEKESITDIVRNLSRISFFFGIFKESFLRSPYKLLIIFWEDISNNLFSNEPKFLKNESSKDLIIDFLLSISSKSSKDIEKTSTKTVLVIIRGLLQDLADVFVMNPMKIAIIWSYHSKLCCFQWYSQHEHISSWTTTLLVVNSYKEMCLNDKCICIWKSLKKIRQRYLTDFKLPDSINTRCTAKQYISKKCTAWQKVWEFLF